MTNRFDGFSINLYQDDKGTWLAQFIERPEISAFGDTPEDALAELAETWNVVKMVCEEKGISLPVVSTLKN